MPALAVRDLAVSRGGVPVLQKVTFSVEPGGALILRGPNGAGKTTLLRTIAGLQRPVAGAIEPGPEAVAYGAHANGMKATLSVRENLSFWAGIHGSANPEGDVDMAMAAFRLTRLKDRASQHLSAGQSRRLGLARMMLTGRGIWAMDEPTVSLDAESVRGFAEVVRRHLAKGGAALIATHADLGLDAPSFDVGACRARIPLRAFW